MKKRWISLGIVALTATLAAAALAVARGDHASAAPKAGLGACLVTDIGGLNDKSFNHLAYVGLLTAERKIHITGRVIQSKSGADYIPNLTSCIRAGAKVTIGVGFLMTDALDTLASKFPQNKFAAVDIGVADLKHHPKNVEGLLFKEQEAGYLVGYAAGLWTKLHPINGTQAIGSIGGIKLPAVDRYIAGYQFGAKKADPGIKVFNSYANSFTAQNKCKELALNDIANGAGVVFQVAGQCGLGVLDAAKEKKVFGIGVDADQAYIGPQVMTSALKRVDVAVYAAIFAANKGTLKTGTNAVFDATKGGVGVGKWSPKVPLSIRRAVAGQLTLLAHRKIKGIPQTVK